MVEILPTIFRDFDSNAGYDDRYDWDLEQNVRYFKLNLGYVDRNVKDFDQNVRDFVRNVWDADSNCKVWFYPVPCKLNDIFTLKSLIFRGLRGNNLSFKVNASKWPKF